MASPDLAWRRVQELDKEFEDNDLQMLATCVVALNEELVRLQERVLEVEQQLARFTASPPR